MVLDDGSPPPEVQLEDLPSECLTAVIGYLDDATDVVRAMRVSKALSAVAGSEPVWRHLAWKDFGVSVPSSTFAAATADAADDTNGVAERAADALGGMRWRRLYGAVRVQLETDTRVLRAHGLYTDGGAGPDTSPLF